MRISAILAGTCTAAALVGATAMASQAPKRLNGIIDLLEQKKPVFGLYAPANRRAPRGAAGSEAPAPQKSPGDLAKEALAYPNADFLFDGSMEGDFDRGYVSFAEFAKGMQDAGNLVGGSSPHFRQPITVKTHEIAENPEVARVRIGKQLNEGVSGVVFVSVESAEELKAGLAMMRLKQHGGTRADDVGAAPARWGMSDKEYRQRADLWPLNKQGELINWTIVESKKGLENIRQIAAVPGIGVLFPGAGTLRGVFSTVDATGKRVLDTAAWEASIQQVLSACKEFKVACGYPATETDIEERMKQGFSVFIMGWGEPGFRAIDIGRKASGRGM